MFDSFKRVAGGLDESALVSGAYDTRMFKLTPKFKMILARGKSMQVRQETERRIVLPNGHTIKVSSDASGVATQIEENERQHAVVRPEAYAIKLTGGHAADGRNLNGLVKWAREVRKGRS